MCFFLSCDIEVPKNHPTVQNCHPSPRAFGKTGLVGRRSETWSVMQQGEPEEDGSTVLYTSSGSAQKCSWPGPCAVEAGVGRVAARWGKWARTGFCIPRGLPSPGPVLCTSASILADRSLSSKHKVCAMLKLFAKIPVLLRLMLEL